MPRYLSLGCSPPPSFDLPRHLERFSSIPKSQNIPTIEQTRRTMSFAIEVPGEATPFTPVELCRTLEAASISTDQAQRQSAGQQIQAWESHPDYYVTLQVGGGNLLFLTYLLQLLTDLFDNRPYSSTSHYEERFDGSPSSCSKTASTSIGDPERNMPFHHHKKSSYALGFCKVRWTRRTDSSHCTTPWLPPRS